MPEPIDQLSGALSESTTGSGDGDGAINGIRCYSVDINGTPDRKPAPAIAATDHAAARAIIEQAKGALMISYRIDPTEAFEVLRKHSQNSNIKLREVAAVITEHVANPRLADLPAAARITHILRHLSNPEELTARPPRPASAARSPSC